MNTEHNDRFWKTYWLFAGGGIAAFVLITLLLIYTRPPIAVETPLPYVPPEDRPATAVQLP